MTRKEARKHLIDWVSYVENPNSIPDFDQPCSVDEIIESMKIGAKVLSESELPEDLKEAAIQAAQSDMQDRQIMEASNDERMRYSRIFRRGFKVGWMARDDQIPKLPNDVDEVAREYSKKCYCPILKHKDGIGLNCSEIETALKAGAEWQKDKILKLIEVRISEIIGDAQPNPVLRIELQGIIDKIK